MTDFSKVADALIELINSKPTSPRKDEIVAVLQAHLGEQWEGPVEPFEPFDPNVIHWTPGVDWSDWSPTTFTTAAPTPYLPTSSISATVDLNEASLEAAVKAISSYRQEDELLRLNTARPLYPCPANTDGVHRMGPAAWHVNQDAQVSSCSCGYKVVLQK